MKGKFIGVPLVVMAALITLITLVAVVLAVDGPKPVDVVIGDAVGAPGQSVGVDIIVDSQDQLVSGFNINLAFDPAVFPTAVGSAGPDPLPESWTLETNLAGPGDLRFLAIDLSGGPPAVLNGAVLHAQFDIAAGAPVGPTSVTTSLADVLDDTVGKFPVVVADGTVTVMVVETNVVVIMGLPPGAVSAEATPRSFKGVAGAQQQLTITATLTDGSQQDVTGSAICASFDPAVATVTAGGLVTITGVGDTRIGCVLDP